MYSSAISANYCEQYVLTNNSEKRITLEIPNLSETYSTIPTDGVDGVYLISLQFDKNGAFVLNPKESIQFGAYVNGRKQTDVVPSINFEAEYLERQKRLEFWKKNLVFRNSQRDSEHSFRFCKNSSL